MMRKVAILLIALVALGLTSFTAAAAADWREEPLRATIKAGPLEATIQGGILCNLTDMTTGTTLLKIDPAQLPGQLPVFGGRNTLDLSACEVTQDANADSVTARWKAADGTTVELKWSTDAVGDLIYHVSAQSAKPVEEIRAFILGGDIAQHKFVCIDGYGVGKQFVAPWNDNNLGDPLRSSAPNGMLHPQVALFEGDGTGWFIEGREERIGPAAMLSEGEGDRVNLGFARRFAEPTNEPALYEIRIRAYKDHWEDAVDPFVKWMEQGVGYVRIENKQPEWVRGIQTQAYIRVGDFDGIEKLAKRVDAKRTFLGRMVGAWIHPMDYGYPDYTLNETAKQWIKGARELGFHVGLHFNTNGISKDRPDLIERFRPGLLVTGMDENGNEIYHGVDGPHRHYYVSSAYKPWREYFIEQIKPAIDAGVDVIYIDESMAASGKFYIDGMTAIEGVMQQEKEIVEAYPHVAIETEQFNPMSARHASFALSQMPLGHPLSGYIFSPFIHVVAEGVMGEPTDGPMMDAHQSWGFMLPSGAKEESWLQIARAFQDYNLQPDSRLARRIFARYERHYSHGMMPALDSEPPVEEGDRLFGYSGDNGVTAYYEKHGNKRGLVVYEPNQPPKWVGTRVSGVSTWSGPGVLREYVPETGTYTDWLIYDGETMLGLDPATSYLMDESATLPANRFHITTVPDDLVLQTDMVRRIRAQDVGPDESWYRVNLGGHGQIAMHVPDDVVVFLDGKEVPVDRETKAAKASIDTRPEEFSHLIAFRQLDRELVGPWVDLPWQAAPNQRSWYVARHVLDDYSPDGPVRMIKPGNGYFNHVGGDAVIVGKLPEATKILLSGAYGMREDSQHLPGDGVVRINGKEVLRVPGGPRPYRVRGFETDVTEFAGQHVMIEFGCEGLVHGAAMADWFAPQVLVETE